MRYVTLACGCRPEFEEFCPWCEPDGRPAPKLREPSRLSRLAALPIRAFDWALRKAFRL